MKYLPNAGSRRYGHKENVFDTTPRTFNAAWFSRNTLVRVLFFVYRGSFSLKCFSLHLTNCLGVGSSINRCRRNWWHSYAASRISCVRWHCARVHYLHALKEETISSLPVRHGDSDGIYCAKQDRDYTHAVSWSTRNFSVRGGVRDVIKVFVSWSR